MTDLTKLTVALTPDAMEALDRIASWQGDTRTDSVQRALVGWDAVLYLAASGRGELSVSSADGRTWTLVIVATTPRDPDPNGGAK